MERSKILVVDDEKLVRRMIARVLESEGMSIVEASNGLDAVQRAKAQPFDLIIRDIIMEGIMEKPFMMAISVRFSGHPPAAKRGDADARIHFKRTSGRQRQGLCTGHRGR